MDPAARLGAEVDVAPERAWLGAVAALVAALVGGSLAFPAQVYEGFVWHYFWGPVQADAHQAACAVRTAGVVEYLGTERACLAAAEGRGSPIPYLGGTVPHPDGVAYPGYTLVSEAGYVALLLFALVGVVFLLQRLDVARDRRFVLALLPYVFFGGALRVVEDATDGVPGLIEYPLNVLLISPIIYVTVFAVTAGALLASVGAERRGLVDRHERPLGATGGLVLVFVLGVLGILGATGRTGGFYPQVFVVVVGAATLLTGGLVAMLGRFRPAALAGPGRRVGAVVVWAHAIDGTANVVGTDWLRALGGPANLTPKHPINLLVLDVARAVIPPSVLAVTGDSWPFLVLKLAVAAGVVAVLDEDLFAESPRYAVLLTVAVVAVGLGPGTRDLLRATLGV